MSNLTFGIWLGMMGPGVLLRLSLYFFICPFIIIHLHDLSCGLLTDCKLVGMQDSDYFSMKCLYIVFQQFLIGSETIYI